MRGVKPPLGLYLFGFCSLILGLYMAIEGLALRVCGAPIAVFGGANLWITIPGLFRQPLAALGWPLAALGCSWLGVLMGVISGLRWAQRLAWVYALISLLYLGIGTALAALAILGLRLPSTQEWLQSRFREGYVGR
jgi:hypothetical protein